MLQDAQCQAFAESLSPAARVALLAEFDRLEERERLFTYSPYPKQIAFHTRGAIDRERLFMAGNQLGKTHAGAAEVSYHATGLYPEPGEYSYPDTITSSGGVVMPHPFAGEDIWPNGWTGRRFKKPIRAWVAGETAETTRDSIQTQLIGPASQEDLWGTGWIPGALIADKPSRQSGTANAIDTVLVKHVSGGKSEIGFKSYGRGREKWQAVPLDLVWFDEEPDYEVYSEGKTRTNATGGIVLVTFTPLKGKSKTVNSYLDAEAGQ